MLYQIHGRSSIHWSLLKWKRFLSNCYECNDDDWYFANLQNKCYKINKRQSCALDSWHLKWQSVQNDQFDIIQYTVFSTCHQSLYKWTMFVNEIKSFGYIFPLPNPFQIKMSILVTRVTNEPEKHRLTFEMGKFLLKSSSVCYTNP